MRRTSEVTSKSDELRSYPLGLGRFRTFFVHEWNVVGRDELYLGCFPHRSTAKHSAQVVIPTHRPCRSSQSLHSLQVECFRREGYEPGDGDPSRLLYLSSIPALSASCSFGQNSTKLRFISPFTA